jgi:hypothetical protein
MPEFYLYTLIKEVFCCSWLRPEIAVVCCGKKTESFRPVAAGSFIVVYYIILELKLPY